MSQEVRDFRQSESGGVMVFWAVALVVFMGLLGLVFDAGRLATTQSELQSFADSVGLAAAAELDGLNGAINRAEAAAQSLITDTQTYADGRKTLVVGDGVSLTFYRPDPNGKFLRDPSMVTTSPFRARFVEVRVADRTISPGFNAAFAALRGQEAVAYGASAVAVAGFEYEACNVAPVAVCLPAVEFDAQAAIGSTLELKTTITPGNLIPGNLAAINSVTNLLDGLSICAGLLGGALDACLIAAREPETACTGQGGLQISADVNGNGLMNAINTRLGVFEGAASSLLGRVGFEGAPNILAGASGIAGICTPLDLSSNSKIGLPTDDCLAFGGCSVLGDGAWAQGRAAYVAAHYDGVDPHPNAQSRYDYYRAEVAAQATPAKVSTSLVGGLLGGVVSTILPGLCVPPTPATPERRLMVVAGIDCTSVNVNGLVSTPPIQTYLEVFVLGPGKNGLLSVEVTACLGGDCGGGNLGTEVHDVVRLVE